MVSKGSGGCNLQDLKQDFYKKFAVSEDLDLSAWVDKINRAIRQPVDVSGDVEGDLKKVSDAIDQLLALRRRYKREIDWRSGMFADGYQSAVGFLREWYRAIEKELKSVGQKISEL